MSAEIDEEIAYYDAVARIAETESGRQILRHADILNAKISGLLTHVSVMIAVLLYFAQSIVCEEKFDSKSWYQIFLYFEIVMYLFVAGACLYCLAITTPKDFNVTSLGSNSLVNTFMIIVRERRIIYLFGLGFTILLTILLILGIVIKGFVSY